METNDTSQNFIEQLKQYLETRGKLFKYEAIFEGSTVFSRIITTIIILIATTIAIVIFSIMLALVLGKLLGHQWMGFGMVTIVYLLVAMFQRLFKISIENMLILRFSKKILGYKSGITKKDEAE